ncbi:MAG: Secretion system C-terminal sorting domain, partial [Bacteroidota bacterium]
PNLIFEQSDNLKFKLYPNPTSDVLMVELADLKQNTVLKIVDMMGKVHYIKNDFDANQRQMISIDVHHLPKGAYFLIAADEQARQVRSFFKLD